MLVQAFINTTYSVYGQYRVRLWCKLKHKWVVVTVDDCFPCKQVRRTTGDGIRLELRDNALDLASEFNPYCDHW